MAQIRLSELEDHPSIGRPDEHLPSFKVYLTEKDQLLAQYNFVLRRGQKTPVKYQSILVKVLLTGDVTFLWLIVATSRKQSTQARA